MIEAMMVALGLLKLEEISDKCKLLADINPLYDGTDWILELSGMLKDHWDEISLESDEIDRSNKKSRKKPELDDAEPAKDLGFQSIVAQAEAENKKLWNAEDIIE